MDFFEHQEQARKKTHLLVFYFALALLGVILGTYAVVVGAAFFLQDSPRLRLWEPELFLFSTVGTTALVLLASLCKTVQLSGGGEVVARELGGRELDLNTVDFHERRLLNVVEEMAIASGVPVPTVYVMDGEDSINAFAAGKSISDAVIGVTRGCMTLLTRDELQGVIAHEFSHILNGDMRINMRLMGLLFGILFISLIGQFLIRSIARGASHSRSRDGAQAALFALAIGASLMIIGYLGAFFARLIKASISRQREYLADASAVQFTRNPDGIGGALMKIGGLSAGSAISHPMAPDASHLFFGNAVTAGLLRTHPPLQKRILRILPHWNGTFGAASLAPVTPHSDSAHLPSQAATHAVAQQAQSSGVSLLDGGQDTPIRLSEEQALESMKAVHHEHVMLGEGLLAHYPEQWQELCHQLSGAQAMLFTLLLAQDDQLRALELSRLHHLVDQSTIDQVVALYPDVSHLHSAAKIGLVDLAIPTLRHLTPTEYVRFHHILQELITSDARVDLFEFTLMRMITRHLDTYFEFSKPNTIRYRHLAQLLPETNLLLSVLVTTSHPGDEAAAAKAFAHAASHFSENDRARIVQGAGTNDLDLIDAALNKYACATPLLKRDFLEASSKAVMEDGSLTSQEAELIRAIADSIACPVPPFVRTAKLI